MTEDNQAKNERIAEDQTQAAGKSMPKQSVTGSTLESSPAQLPVRKTVQVNYQSNPPPSAHEEPPEEPPKKVPVVPPGDYEEDADDSPPVHFDDPEEDEGSSGDNSPSTDADEAADKTNAEN